MKNQLTTKFTNSFDAFVQLMDAMNYEGYAQQLAADQPERFNFELNDFLNIYGK